MSLNWISTTIWKTWTWSPHVWKREEITYVYFSHGCQIDVFGFGPRNKVEKFERRVVVGEIWITLWEDLKGYQICGWAKTWKFTPNTFGSWLEMVIWNIFEWNTRGTGNEWTAHTHKCTHTSTHTHTLRTLWLRSTNCPLSGVSLSNSVGDSVSKQNTVSSIEWLRVAAAAVKLKQTDSVAFEGIPADWEKT